MVKKEIKYKIFIEKMFLMLLGEELFNINENKLIKHS